MFAASQGQASGVLSLSLDAAWAVTSATLKYSIISSTFKSKVRSTMNAELLAVSSTFGVGRSMFVTPMLREVPRSPVLVSTDSDTDFFAVIATDLLVLVVR